MRYARPSTNLDVVKAADLVSRDMMAGQLARVDGEGGASQALDPLRINVPSAGVHYAFEKLYANQADQDAWIVLPYASAAGAVVGRLTSVFGALLFWLGLALFFRPDPRLPQLPPRVSLVVAGAGLLLVLICAGLYHVGTLPALLVSLAVVTGTAIVYGRRMLEMRA